MKVLQINSFSNGSTGNIMMHIHDELEKHGDNSLVIYGRGKKTHDESKIYLNDKLGVINHVIYSRFTGKSGFASKHSTKRIIRVIEKFKPDIIHLHNIHGYYINIYLLFNYLKEKKIKVVWTLHDCWAFTGQCAYFTKIDCKKWKKICYKCMATKDYPKSFVDNSKWNYTMKRNLFTGLDLTIVTPSKWLADLVKQSFLKDYRIKVINNGIDLNIFKPTKSSLRTDFKLENKIIILGVANVWDERKGLKDFLELAKIIDERYQIVLIGLSQKQIKTLPKTIIGIQRTENQTQLASWYSTADVFFNPSLEETFGLTTIEALSCGTSVVAYNSSAITELIDKKFIVECGNIKKVYEKIQMITKSKDGTIYNCKYSNEKMVKKYIELYEKIHNNYD